MNTEPWLEQFLTTIRQKRNSTGLSDAFYDAFKNTINISCSCKQSMIVLWIKIFVKVVVESLARHDVFEKEDHFPVSSHPLWLVRGNYNILHIQMKPTLSNHVFHT